MQSIFKLRLEIGMRVMFVCSFYPPYFGGGSSRLSDFSRILASMELRVGVFTFIPFKLFSKNWCEFVDGVKVFRLPSFGLKHPLDQIFTGFLGTLVFSFLFKPNVLVVSLPPGEPCIGVFLASLFLRKTVVVDVRDEWEDCVIRRTRRFPTRILYRFYRRFFGCLYRRSAFVSTVTPTLVKRLRERGSEEVYLLPNGADTELFRPKSLDECQRVRRLLNLEKDDFVLVYAGNVGAYYRVDVVIEALHKVVKLGVKNIKFVVIGDGEDLKRCTELCEHLGLKENVLFLGRKSREEVARILPCCDVGVVPFDDDPIWLSAYTTKFFEYCSCGLPVIVLIVRGSDLERLVLENDVGFVVKPLDVDDTALAIWKMYKNRDVLERMRMNARSLVVKKFDRSKIVGKLASLLREKFSMAEL